VGALSQCAPPPCRLSLKPVTAPSRTRLLHFALRTMYGLPIETDTERELIRQCTGRDPSLLPQDGFQTSLLLVGCRSGKSRIAGLTAAFEAALSGREKLLSPGKIGLVVVVSPTKFQSRIVRKYIRAAFDSTPILKNEIVDEGKDTFTLRNGVEIHSFSF
jgi:hypothetical protein